MSVDDAQRAGTRGARRRQRRRPVRPQPGAPARARVELIAEAADGAAGVDLVKAGRPDLVLLDISRSVMDGLEALEVIREDCPDSVVVMLTTVTSPKVAHQALAVGAHGHIVKGGNVPLLMNQLRSMLADERGTVGSRTDDLSSRPR